MSLSALCSAASTALSALNVHPHGHKRGAHSDQLSDASVTSATSSSSSSLSAAPIGQLPVGAATPLFNNLLQSLTQTLGAQAAGATPAANLTAASVGDLQKFHHGVHSPSGLGTKINAQV